MPRVWLVDATGTRQPIDDTLVLALHTPDDAPAIAGDLRLELDLVGAPPVGVLLSKFLEVWLPKLPASAAVVLAVCNPHATTLAFPTPRPLHVPSGDVESWFDRDGDRIELVAESWSRLGVP